MATRTNATLAALALSTALATSAFAVPQYRVDLTDTAGGVSAVTSYYNVTSGPVSTSTITFDGYTFSMSLNSNYPGTNVLGSLSQSFTFSGSLAGANRDFYSTITIVDSGSQNAQAKFTAPNISGGGYSLVSDASNTANASITSGSTQVSSRANATPANNALNPFIGGGSTPTVTVAVPADPTGYSLTNTIFFSNIVANGAAGLTSITASATSSVQATPAATVPEPASLALLGAGLAGAGLLRRRAK